MLIDGIKLVEGSEFENLSIAIGTTFPAQPNAGELFYRSDFALVYVYNGSAWNTISTALSSGAISTALGYVPVAPGDNSSITSLNGLTSPLSVLQGGTGVTVSTGTGAGVHATSPALLGVPTAPTPDVADLSTAIATTAFVKSLGYITAATAPVTSVAGRAGTILLTTSDVPESTNLYFTTSRASDAAPVQSVFGRTGAVVLTAADVPPLAYSKITTGFPTTVAGYGITDALTAANIGGVVTYATWNPADKSSAVVLSNGNLTVDGLSINYGVRSTIGVSSGRHYWEVHYDSSGSNGASPEIGVNKSTDRLNNPEGGTTSVTWNSSGELARFGVKQPSYGDNGGFSVGQTIGILLDMDAGTVNFYRNGVDQGLAAMGLTGTYYSVIGDGSTNSTGTFTANFGSTTLAYPVAGTIGLSVVSSTPVAVISFNTRKGAVTLSLSDVTTALGFTPANAGANSNITSLSGLTTALSVLQGGTGSTTSTGTGSAVLSVSPALTGVPTAPTASTADSSTTLATTAFVKAQGYTTATSAPVTSVAGRTGDVILAVADVSGAATSGANSNITSLSGLSTALSVLQGGTGVTTSTGSGSNVLSVSPALTGTPTAPTASAADSSTTIATTAFVKAQGYGTGTGTGDFLANGSVPMTGVLRIITGSTSNPFTPGLAFAAETGLGISRLGSGNLSIVANGGIITQFQANGITFNASTQFNNGIYILAGTASVPALQFTASATPLSTVSVGAFEFDGSVLTIGITGLSRRTFAYLESPSFSGTPTAPTQAASDNSTRLASTAFVTSAVSTGTAIIDGGSY